MATKLVDPATWNWFYDQTRDRLGVTVVTDDSMKWLGYTRYGAKLLSNEAIMSLKPFTSQDCNAFSNFYDRLSDMYASSGDRAWIALNAVAMKRFHKERVLVDECFQSVERKYPPEEGEVVVIATTYKGANGKAQEGTLLVVDVDSTSCYGILLNTTPVEVQENRVMNLCSCIRVSHNRVISMSALNSNLLQTLNIA